MQNKNKNRANKSSYFFKSGKKIENFFFYYSLVQAIAGSIIAIRWIKICVSESLNGRYRVHKGTTFSAGSSSRRRKNYIFKDFFKSKKKFHFPYPVE